MGDVPDAAVAVGAATAAGWIATRGALAWARRRCGEALAAAGTVRRPEERSLALVATLEGRPVSRAQARDQRALQQALDGSRTDGALLARRAVRAAAPGRCASAGCRGMETDG